MVNVRKRRSVKKKTGRSPLLKGDDTVFMGIKVPKSYRTTVDKFWKKNGYKNRSDYVRELFEREFPKELGKNGKSHK